MEIGYNVEIIKSNRYWSVYRWHESTWIAQSRVLWCLGWIPLRWY